MSEMKLVTVEHAREALESMDDYARMDVGVDASGPREVLERFIAEHERVVAELRALSVTMKADAIELRREGEYGCCACTYEYAAGRIDAILRGSEALAMGPTHGPWSPSYDKGSTRDIFTKQEEYAPQQPAAVDEAAAIHAFEEHFQASAEDPYFESELELWLTAWRKALAAHSKQGDEQ